MTTAKDVRIKRIGVSVGEEEKKKKRFPHPLLRYPSDQPKITQRPEVSKLKEKKYQELSKISSRKGKKGKRSSQSNIWVSSDKRRNQAMDRHVETGVPLNPQKFCEMPALCCG